MVLRITLTKFRGSHKYKRQQYITKQTTTATPPHQNNNGREGTPWKKKGLSGMGRRMRKDRVRNGHFL